MSRASRLIGDATDLWFSDEVIPFIKKLEKDGYDCSNKDEATKFLMKFSENNNRIRNIVKWTEAVSNEEYDTFYSTFIKGKSDELVEIEELAREISRLEAQAHKYDGIYGNKKPELIRRLMNEYIDGATGADVHDWVTELGRLKGIKKVQEFKSEILKVLKSDE